MGWPRGGRWAVAGLALGLGALAPVPGAAQGGVPAAGLVAPPAAAADGPGLSALSALQRAWARGDVDGVVALFAPEGVVVLDPAHPGGPDLYGRAPTAGPLRAGVHQLLADGAQIDVAGHRAAAVVFAGAPATRATWAYGRPRLVPAVPPEVGEDAVVLRGGQIASYTRVPDGVVQAARAGALGRLVPAPAPRVARGTRGTEPAPAGDLHLVAALCGLAGLASLVLLKRSRRPPRT
jgi:hypothetical protein